MGLRGLISIMLKGNRAAVQSIRRIAIYRAFPDSRGVGGSFGVSEVLD
jgi:hypothetical protein